VGNLSRESIFCFPFSPPSILSKPPAKQGREEEGRASRRRRTQSLSRRKWTARKIWPLPPPLCRPLFRSSAYLPLAGREGKKAGDLWLLLPRTSSSREIGSARAVECIGKDLQPLGQKRSTVLPLHPHLPLFFLSHFLGDLFSPAVLSQLWSFTLCPQQERSQGKKLASDGNTPS